VEIYCDITRSQQLSGAAVVLRWSTQWSAYIHPRLVYAAYVAVAWEVARRSGEKRFLKKFREFLKTYGEEDSNPRPLQWRNVWIPLRHLTTATGFTNSQCECHVEDKSCLFVVDILFIVFQPTRHRRTIAAPEGCCDITINLHYKKKRQG